ncbi:hypothetical protein N836_20860 [Leptolyngbya sp. Heron Island J]|nr:hypothetical protein N836_20860 [Leptolyngbya sp. Heron Island J]
MLDNSLLFADIFNAAARAVGADFYTAQIALM